MEDRNEGVRWLLEFMLTTGVYVVCCSDGQAAKHACPKSTNLRWTNFWRASNGVWRALQPSSGRWTIPHLFVTSGTYRSPTEPRRRDDRERELGSHA
jgi:hypothetical protein